VLPDAATLRDVLRARAAADPDLLAFDDGRRSVTFRQLLERAAGQAAELASAGVGPGDRVALVMSSGVSFAEAFWAAQLLGAATCAFNPNAPPPTLARRVARARPRVVVEGGTLDGAATTKSIPPEPPTDSEDVATLQPTSGTSGEPRIAMVRHRNVLAYLRGLGKELVSPGDVMVQWVPAWHDLGLVRFVVAAAYMGAPCHIVEPAVRTIPRFLATVSRTRARVTGAPDFAYRLAARMVDPATVDLSCLRVATNGGEPVRHSTIVAFESHFGLSGAMLPAYGLAESTLGVTAVLPGEPLAVDERGTVACGSHRSGAEVRIDGDATTPGEILLRGDIVFAGYLDAPEATEEVLRGGWLHTGDTGYLDDEGRLYVLGRERAMIKRGGAVVAPRELEEAAQSVEGVRIVAAVGVPDAAGMTEAAAVVVEHERAGSGAAAAVAKAVERAVLASAGFAPATVKVVPPRTIPRTENGKIRHARLRELLLEGVIEEAADAGARAGTR
jgi:fatty-acyl-CoA synthase